MAQQKTGVILVNLGTPESPTPRSVRKFLREFLSDRRVVDVPRLPWQILLNTIILPLRSPKVARAYQSIWTERGSPLRKITEDQTESLNLCLSTGGLRAEADSERAQVRTTWAMTYGGPSIESRVKELVDQGINKILVIPLYPQFSTTTTGAVYDRVLAPSQKGNAAAEIRCVHDYHDHPLYIKALAATVTEHWAENGKSKRLLMSFHGLPESYVAKGDPYVGHCRQTADSLARELGLGEVEWAYSFQSRFGPGEWVKPYTDKLLVEWAQAEIKEIDVICPSFSADCLETLDEIGVRYNRLFMKSGGNKLSLIPCLNNSPSSIALLEALVVENIW
ncbi:MAG: ferrochelatase [Gammaproteobacteria bacterium]|nr:MAG: ferrochelatase [Gammaproteobacteria bacterium]RLA54782.1 MAG: ferrochelatase [Gammaproteobacteria bacterium]